MELSLTDCVEIGQYSKSLAFALCDKWRKIKTRESEKLRNNLKRGYLKLAGIQKGIIRIQDQSILVWRK
jgi:hypothetical protein